MPIYNPSPYLAINDNGAFRGWKRAALGVVWGVQSRYPQSPIGQ